ncbi:MAG TPA: asparagine synthase (glutamine-hydrolyzing) [Thermoanaerobaculia bacterium]|nr:asparagine synthase (glutamine-hydrolyzing) [Thermoanaerobaculia bacterium]
MCGINGLLRLHPDAPEIDPAELVACREAMARRGPDDAGQWVSPGGRVALGHRRLSILDLSAAGHQPMSSPDGRTWIVFNGEIFNFRALRAELLAQGERFTTESDTEVVLALHARFGAEMLGRLRGMFALAIWDDREQTLLLARDPSGIKPLYYSTEGGVLRFASQVKALLAGGKLRRDVEPAGLAGFLLWGSVPEPWTFRRGILQLPAGHFLVVGGEGAGSPGAGRPRPYRSPEPFETPGPTNLTAALEGSVAAHLVSDVPVAVFLSAGLDSSLVAALARRLSPEPPITFTLSFDLLAGTPLDEAPLARETARVLGTRHVERRVGRGVFEALWADALAAMDQPSIDGFNTFLVSRMAHEVGIKVALSGLGGDELFGSYPSFRDVPRWHQAARLAAALPGLGPLWPTLTRPLAGRRPKLPGLLRYGRSFEGAYYLRRALFLPEELPALIGRDRAEEGLRAYDPLADATGQLRTFLARRSLAERAEAAGWVAVHALESSLYLRNQLLRDADWASMAHSLELRVPLVDAWLEAHVLAAIFARDPGRAALEGVPFPPWRSKREVVRAAAPELPAALFERPKTGFYIPISEWASGAGRPLPGHARGSGSRRLALAVAEAFGALPGG